MISITVLDTGEYREPRGTHRREVAVYSKASWITSVEPYARFSFFFKKKKKDFAKLIFK